MGLASLQSPDQPSRQLRFVVALSPASHASLLTLLVGLAAAAVGAQPGYVPMLITGVLFQLASVLDGVDGEMARSYADRVGGGRPDHTLVDQATYLACLVGITIGWVCEGSGMQALVWGVVIALALVGSLVRGGLFVSRHAPTASFAVHRRLGAKGCGDSGDALLKAWPPCSPSCAAPRVLDAVHVRAADGCTRARPRSSSPSASSSPTPRSRVTRRIWKKPRPRRETAESPIDRQSPIKNHQLEGLSQEADDSLRACLPGEFRCASARGSSG